MVSVTKPNWIADMDISQKNYKQLLELVPGLADLEVTKVLTMCGTGLLHIDAIHSFGE